MDLPVLFIDRDVVVIAKPAGLLSEHDRFGAPAVESLLATQLGTKHGPARLWLVHRLDAGTSGVLLLARTPAAARALGAAFRDGTVEKTYVALAQGRLRGKQTIDGPIARARGTRHEVSPGGKPAATEVWPVEHGPGVTLVACRPHSGRTHQIRVHLAHIGHPLLGDRLYGGPGYYGEAPATPIARPMLHALRLRVQHPRTGEPLSFDCPPADDIVALARALGAWRDGGLRSLADSTTATR